MCHGDSIGLGYRSCREPQIAGMGREVSVNSANAKGTATAVTTHRIGNTTLARITLTAGAIIGVVVSAVGLVVSAAAVGILALKILGEAAPFIMLAPLLWEIRHIFL